MAFNFFFFFTTSTMRNFTLLTNVCTYTHSYTCVQMHTMCACVYTTKVTKSNTYLLYMQSTLISYSILFLKKNTGPNPLNWFYDPRWKKTLTYNRLFSSSFLRRVIYFEVIIPITAYYLQSIAEHITLKYSYNCDTTSYSA